MLKDKGLRVEEGSVEFRWVCGGLLRFGVSGLKQNGFWEGCLRGLCRFGVVCLGGFRGRFGAWGMKCKGLGFGGVWGGLLRFSIGNLEKKRKN